MVTSEQRRPTINRPLPVPPANTEPVDKWFEVALCERLETGEVVIKDIQRSFLPEFTFHEGLHPDKYYALAIRRVEKRGGAFVTGDWSDLTEWRKPNRSREHE